MMTTATGSVEPSACAGESRRRSGRRSGGSPGSTAASVATPRVGRSSATEQTAPSAIIAMAIGNFGNSRLPASRIPSAASPSASDSQWISPQAAMRCRVSSGSSPVPAVPPRSFGVCMRMMVQQMPLMNPPMTGVEMKLSTFPARSAANSSSQSAV